MKTAKGILVFIAAFLVYHLIGSSFFPVNEENVLQAPDWYPVLGIAIATFATYLLCKPREKKAGSAIVDAYKRRKTKQTYDSLSEVEKWQLEKAQTIEQPTDHSPAIEVDNLTNKAAMIIFETGQASVSMIQRRVQLGYAKAARIVDYLETVGVVGPFVGSTPRKAIISKEDYLKRVRIVDSVKPAKPAPQINIQQIIKDEQEWRRKQQGLPLVEYELQQIDSMEGHQFEYWCANLLRKNGFTNVEVTQGSGDQGVDITAVKDGIRYAIQCKCYSSDLGNKPVQEVNTGKTIYHCQVGVVMTNRYFTAGAKQAAEPNGVLLWDRDKLIEMLDG